MKEAESSRCPVQQSTEWVSTICARTFQRPDADGKRRRPFHRKTLALVQANLQITPPEEDQLCHGLFGQAGSYEAWARFSCGFFEKDREPDARGLAIKIRGLQGEVSPGAPEGVQDFILMNQQAGLFSDHADVLNIFRMLDGRPIQRPRDLIRLANHLVPGWNPMRVRWGMLWNGLQEAWGILTCKDLHRFSYDSLTPYQVGNTAVRYHFRPTPATRSRIASSKAGLRERLQSVLNEGPITFDLLLRARREGIDPLDDGTRKWQGPLHAVGRLEIPSQDLNTHMDLAEDIAFSPWNCLTAHQPLGTVNELRRQVYKDAMENRNGSPAFPEAS